MARKRHTRASFVVTFAVSAASACGGGVASDGNGGAGGSGGSGSGGSGGYGANPPIPACPSETPDDGSTCTGFGQICNYDASIDECGQTLERVARCKGSKWKVSWKYPGTSCNPPPPPQSVCYEFEPTAGDWCDTVPDLVCSYPSGCCSRTYECVNHQWAETTPPCNPPIPICPETVPTANSPCDDPCDVSYTCDYGGCAPDAGSSQTATCVGGVWQVSDVDCG